MKKILLGIVILFPLQAFSADDSVYTWGTWSQGIQPAAGPVAHVATPAPVLVTNVNLRPNEHAALNRAPGLTSLAARSLNQGSVSVGAPTSTTGPSTGGF